MTRKGFIRILLITLTAVSIFVLVEIGWNEAERKKAAVEAAYSEACGLISEGNEQEALELLEEIDVTYMDCAALKAFCKVGIVYDTENFRAAGEAAKRLDLPDFSGKLQSYINHRLLEIGVSYHELLEQDRIEAMDKIRNGIPYVGMSEDYIGITSLGKPSEDVRHNFQCINGEQYFTNLYDFYNGKKVIFTARCISGRVTEIWDWRDSPDVSVPSFSPKPSSDPYNVDEYSNEEDFFDDHYDDFFSYEDAEEYYYDHTR